MNINYSLLSFGWFGGAILGITGAGGYLIYDYKNPTGGQRLLGRGYIFNPPKLTSGNNSNKACFENLFKEISELDESKLYACGVASIDIYNNEGQFKSTNKVVSFLSFRSEIWIRKENNGWHVSTTFDNLSGDAQYSHKIEIYKKQDTGYYEKTKEIWAFIEEIPKSNQSEENSANHELLLGSKNLNIKVPAGHWYKEKNYFVQVNRTSEEVELEKESAKSFKETKLWSGVWIEEHESYSSWIFQDIEIFIEDKKYSQIFCKSEKVDGGDCRQKLDDDDEIWISGDQDKEKVQQMIQQINESKGKWIDTEKFCKRSRSRNLQDKELKNLELFCFSKQN